MIEKTNELKKGAYNYFIRNNKGVIKELMEIFETNIEFYEWMLILTIIASYYTNSELILSNKLPKFTLKVIDCFIKLKLGIEDESCNINKHVKYLKKQKEIYDEILNFWIYHLDTRGNLKSGSIFDILYMIRGKLYEYSDFRKVDVVHGEGLRLPKNVRNKRYIDDYKRVINSMFVFPPVRYIPTLLDFLDKKLKERDIDVYKKAAYIGSVIFLAHPFNDGNSRASRISMISYLDANGKNFYRIYTFISNFVYQSGNIESYLDFLYKVVYPKYWNKIKSKIQLDDRGSVVKYIPINDYIAEIIEEVAEELKRRLIRVGKEIFGNIQYITKIIKLLKLYENTIIEYGFDSKEVIILNNFMIQIFGYLHKSGLKGFEEKVSLSKKKIKNLNCNFGISDEEIKVGKEKILEVLK